MPAAPRREVDLQNPDTLTVAKAQGLTLTKLIRWYIDAYESVSPWQRSKQCALEFLEEHPIGQRDPFTLTPDVLITHVRQRRLGGVSPSTAAMAAAAVSVAHRRGLDVPGDLSIVGFDDTTTATTIWPELTTIRRPIVEMANIESRILHERIEHGTSAL